MARHCKEDIAGRTLSRYTVTARPQNTYTLSQAVNAQTYPGEKDGTPVHFQLFQ
jgi:hypothetical protein